MKELLKAKKLTGFVPGSKVLDVPVPGGEFKQVGLSGYEKGEISEASRQKLSEASEQLWGKQREWEKPRAPVFGEPISETESEFRQRVSRKEPIRPVAGIPTFLEFVSPGGASLATSAGKIRGIGQGVKAGLKTFFRRAPKSQVAPGAQTQVSGLPSEMPVAARPRMPAEVSMSTQPSGPPTGMTPAGMTPRPPGVATKKVNIQQKDLPAEAFRETTPEITPKGFPKDRPVNPDPHRHWKSPIGGPDPRETFEAGVKEFREIATAAKKQPQSTETFETLWEKLKSGKLKLSLSGAMSLHKAMSLFLSESDFTNEGIYRKICLQSFVR